MKQTILKLALSLSILLGGGVLSAFDTGALEQACVKYLQQKYPDQKDITAETSFKIFAPAEPKSGFFEGFRISLYEFILKYGKEHSEELYIDKDELPFFEKEMARSISQVEMLEFTDNENIKNFVEGTDEEVRSEQMLAERAAQAAQEKK